MTLAVSSGIIDCIDGDNNQEEPHGKSACVWIRTSAVVMNKLSTKIKYTHKKCLCIKHVFATHRKLF